jgi:hypothetical protein
MLTFLPDTIVFNQIISNSKVVTMATALVRPSGKEKSGPIEVISSLDQIPPLGAPEAEKRFWWQRAKGFNREAIATQVNFKDIPT